MQKIGKCIVVLLSIILISCIQSFGQVSVWNGSFSRWTRGNGTEQNPYLIDSASQLAYLAQSVNSGIMYTDSFFMLTADIDLNRIPWTPIGQNLTNFFIGSFNGNNHEISNLNIVDTVYRSGIVYVGLFGYVLDAHIYNILISENSEILVSFSSSSNFYAGGIVGYAYNSKINNCYNKSKVSVFALSSYGFAGGILAYGAAGSKIYNSKNSGVIRSSSSGIAYGGGIYAHSDNSGFLVLNSYNHGSIFVNASKYAYAGGIVAQMNNSTSIKQCFNLGTINANAENYAYAGGLAGLGSTCSISCCYNEGEINAFANDYSCAGGIIGMTEYTSSLSDIYNLGEVRAHSYYFRSFVGGIIGFMYNYSFTPTYVNDCYHIGQMKSVASDRAFLGGIIGEISMFVDVNQGFYLKSSLDFQSNAEGIASNDAFLHSQMIVDSLNKFDTNWLYDNAFLNKGYPLLLHCGRSIVITETPLNKAGVIVLNGRALQRVDSILACGFAFKKHSQSLFTYIKADTSFCFKTQLSSLLNDTMYDCQAFIVISNDTIFGNILSFSLENLQVTTDNPSSLESHSVILQGKIVYGFDTIIEKGFEWKKVSDNVVHYLSVNYIHFLGTLIDLSSNTLYCYRAYAVTNNDTVFGNYVYFTTPIQHSVVITQSATDITPYRAKLNAYIVNGDDSVFFRGFEWKVFSATTSTFILLNDTVFSVYLNSLLPNTNYMYRACVITATDTLYGEYVTFSTLQSCVLTTHQATEIDLHTAILNGSVSVGDELIFMQGFAWHLADDTVESFISVEGSSISDTLDDLQPNTTYSYRVFAVTPNGIFYGNEISFQTLQYSADVSTFDATDITATSSVIHGKITQGEEIILMQGFEWKANKASNYFVINVAGNEISDTLKGLQPATSYTFRAFLLTESGTLYGEKLTFTTLNDVTINTVDDKNSINIFPNPVSNYLTLEINQNKVGSRVEVYDVYGKQLLIQYITNESNILDFSELSAGIYWLQIKNNTKTFKILKVVKE